MRTDPRDAVDQLDIECQRGQRVRQDSRTRAQRTGPVVVQQERRKQEKAAAPTQPKADTHPLAAGLRMAQKGTQG